MSVTTDANVLVYASADGSPFQAQARGALEELLAGPNLWYLFWPVAIAYLRIASHPAVLEDPLTSADALANLEGLLAAPHVRSPGEGEGFLSQVRAFVEELSPRGNLVSDAHVVALMRQYGVREIVTHDRDFRKFDGIRVRDPFA